MRGSSSLSVPCTARKPRLRHANRGVGSFGPVSTGQPTRHDCFRQTLTSCLLVNRNIPSNLVGESKVRTGHFKSTLLRGGRSPSQVVSQAPPSALYGAADVSPVATVFAATIHHIDDDPLHRLQLQRGRGEGRGPTRTCRQRPTRHASHPNCPSPIGRAVLPACCLFFFFIDNRLLWPFDNFDLVSCGCSMLTTQRPRGLSACSTSNVDILHQRPHPVLPTTRFIWPIAFLPVPDCLY